MSPRNLPFHHIDRSTFMHTMKFRSIPGTIKLCAVITGVALHVGLYFAVVPHTEAERTAIREAAQEARLQVQTGD
jgi:hypothetical protein